MNDYMYNPAVLYPLIPFLSSLSYGKLLSTCTEIKNNYDLKTEWKKRSPNIRENNKGYCMIKEQLKNIRPGCMLNEITTKQTLLSLLQVLRDLYDRNKLLNIYHHYLHSDQCPKLFRSIVQRERIIVGYNNGMKLNLIYKKRKRNAQAQESCIQASIRRLRLDRQTRRNVLLS